jgi:hypothetical protein
MTDFNEKMYDTIIRDIDKSIKKSTFSIDDIELVRMDLMKSINKKPYESAELNDVTNSLKTNIDKVKFNKKYFRSISNKVKINKKKISNVFSSLEDLSGLSFFQQVKVVIKIIIRTLVNIIDDFVIMFMTICIVLNLFFRANVPLPLLYPSNPNEFPYVFFDHSSLNKQSHLTSTVEINDKDPEDDVFLDTPAYFSNDGKYVIDKNICKINDPYGVSDKASKASCSNKADPSFSKYFTNNASYENMSFFAKRFIESNSLKKKDELNLYSTLTYAMLFSTQNTNSYFSGLASTVQGVFPKQESSKLPSSMVLFFVMCAIVYGMCQSNKFAVSNVIKKIIFNDETNKFNKFNILGKTLDIISSFFAPFLNIFKLIFIFVYPMVLFSLVYGYINYSTLTSSMLNKFFCYLGIGNSFVTLLMYVLMFIYIITNKALKNKSINAIFDEVFGKFISLIKFGIEKLQRFIVNPGGNKSSTKKGKGKSGKGGKGSGSINNKTCTEPKTGLEGNILRAIIGVLFLMFAGPALIILFMIPFVVSTTMTFNITKALTLDFWKYMSKIICMMSDFKLIIRLLFYAIIILEISKYASKKFALIMILTLAFIIIMDLRKDYIKKMLETNKCLVEENGLSVGEKVSEIVLSTK